MGSFGIYVIVVTFIFVIYYVVMICLDLFGTKGEKKDSVEVIHTGAPVGDIEEAPTATPVRVKEESDGKYTVGHSDRISTESSGEDAARSEYAPTESQTPPTEDIDGEDNEELAAQSKAKIDGIKQDFKNVSPSIQGAVSVEEFPDTFAEALQKQRYEEEQAEQLSL